MYLLIDIGNTRIKWQQRDEENIISSKDTQQFILKKLQTKLFQKYP